MRKVTTSAILMLVMAMFFACKETKKEENKIIDAEVSIPKEVEKYGGLALYTVRDDMGENAKETLKSVADAGYVNIEAASYSDGKFYNMPPQEFQAYLNEIGLNPVSTHQGSVTLENADTMMADVKAAGFKYFVIPVPPMGMFEFNVENRTMSMNGTVEELAQILDTLGEKANATGLELLYHNHDFEFKENTNGIVTIDYLLENCNPELVNFQIDLYWVTKAGADPLAYFEKYPGRFKIWHVKDMDDQGRFAPVGKGTIDFQRILDQKEQSGMEYYMVEQDMTFDGLEPLEAIKISHEGLREIGFK